jgi:hypothetical protein
MSQSEARFWFNINRRVERIRRDFLAQLRGIAAELGEASLANEDSIERLKRACKKNSIGKTQSDVMLDKAILEGMAEGKLTATPENKVHVSDDPWINRVGKMPKDIIYTSVDGRELVTTAAILAHVMQIPRVEQRSSMGRRLRLAMEAAGWKRNPSGKLKIDGRTLRGFWRYAPPR